MIINGALFANPRPQFFDGNGDPLADGKLYFYTTGTSTPEDTFTDIALTTPHANPVVLDADGRAPAIYLSPIGYKVICMDADDVEQWTIDGVQDVAQVVLAELGVTLADGARDVQSGYTVLETDHTLTVDGTGGVNPCVITLPAANERLWPLLIINRGDVPIAVTPDGVDTINGVAGALTIAAASSPLFPGVLLLPDGGTDWMGFQSKDA